MSRDGVPGAGRRRRWPWLLALLALAWGAAALYDRPRGGAGAWLCAGGLEARQLPAAGLSLRVVRAGPPGRAPLLLLHGFASSAYTWHALLPELSREHDVVAFDLPGFGFSEMPAHLRWSQLAEATLALADTLRLERFTLVGHSLGGAVAVSVAAGQPRRVERLVLIDSAGFNLSADSRPALVGLTGRPGFAALARALPARRLLLRAGLRQVFHDPRQVDAARLEEYLAPLARPEWLPAMRSLMESRAAASSDEFPSLLARLEAPVLLLWGRHDRWAPLAQAGLFQQALPAARLRVFEDCGHMPQEEQPQEVLRELRAFLVEVPAGR